MQEVADYLARHVDPRWLYLVAESVKSIILAGEHYLKAAAKVRAIYERVVLMKDGAFKALKKDRDGQQHVFKMLIRMALDVHDYDESYRKGEKGLSKDIYVLRSAKIRLAWSWKDNQQEVWFADYAKNAPWMRN